MIMNSTIFLSTAAILATALLQPLEAKPKEHKGGGKKAAATQKAHAPKVAQRSRPAPKQFTQHSKGSQKHFAQRSQPSQKKQFHQRAQGSSVANRGETGNAKFRNQNRQQPTIAFGGAKHRDNDRDVNFQANRRSDRNVTIDNRRYGGNRYVRNGNDYRQYRPPTYVFRDWDRGHTHRWNNHNYRWYNNDWIIIDAGFGSPYYGYDSGPVVEYGMSGNTAIAVQRELSRRGYDPGVIDGVIGSQSRDAIAAYQQDNGLPVTGRIDGSLLRDMGL
jgi:hypothetical protein